MATKKKRTRLGAISNESVKRMDRARKIVEGAGSGYRNLSAYLKDFASEGCDRQLRFVKRSEKAAAAQRKAIEAEENDLVDLLNLRAQNTAARPEDFTGITRSLDILRAGRSLQASKAKVMRQIRKHVQKKCRLR